MNRGGRYNNGSNAGLFNFNRNTGGGNTNNSFRSVLSLALCINSCKMKNKNFLIEVFLQYYDAYIEVSFQSVLYTG
ncbi:MAG: hypothetical protein IJ743_02365 [Bacilli bacterium]|nr:hypothetical protein [Bacilli bacterium]MBR1748623.1 hypothetical protein [Bacilli bacterium]MBR1817936.1 hypothetical protein [Bacilli bacterium]